MKAAIAQLLNVSERTIYNWSKEKRPIIPFLYKYFSENDILNYIKFGQIEKLELLNTSTPLTLHELQSLATILYKIEECIIEEKINRERFLIKFYRTIRDYTEEGEDFVSFVSSYKMKSTESFRNVLYSSSFDDVINFYQNYLSVKERKLLFEKKFYIMPVLKSMRKYNAHLKD